MDAAQRIAEMFYLVSRAVSDRHLIELWHNEAHLGPFATCDELPCHALVRFVPPPADWGPEGQCPFCGCSDPGHAK